MTRRGLVLAGVAGWLGKQAAGSPEDDAREIWELLTRLGAALSGGNLNAFLEEFDPVMPGYPELQANVSALLGQYEVQSSIELLREEADHGTRTVDLDWFFQLEEQRDAGSVTRRRERVHCRLEKRGKKWKITKLEPLAFFAPPQ
jgi:hypothetical protein